MKGVRKQEKLDVKQGHAARLLWGDGLISGVEITLGVQYLGWTVIVTTGTFLRGLLHFGKTQQSGGRAGEAAEMSLSKSLVDLGLELGRLKTGTPPRLLRRSIDFSKLEVQPGDEPVPFFSYWKDRLFHVEHFAGAVSPNRPSAPYPPGSILNELTVRWACYVTYTTPATSASSAPACICLPLFWNDRGRRASLLPLHRR